MSINERNITEGINLRLQKELGNRYDLAITEISRVSQLLSHAKTEPVDLFILLLNNMLFDTPSFTEPGHSPPLEVVSHLRAAYGQPILAMTGSWLGKSSGAEVEAEALRVGATCLLFLPYTSESFIEAIEKCLKEAEFPSSS
jgi:hypothetical protein